MRPRVVLSQKVNAGPLSSGATTVIAMLVFIERLPADSPKWERTVLPSRLPSQELSAQRVRLRLSFCQS
jgi:hypothetical protein